jgi:hypothetical protein
MRLNIKQLSKRAKQYVESQAHTKVLRVTFAGGFTLFGNQDIVLSVSTTDRKHPQWWVVGGSTPMNLYSKTQIPSADEAFSFHSGIMMRMLDDEFEASKTQPRDIGYDAFICHASEDKDQFVRPLAKALTRLGLRVWYDEFTLEVGDSLRRSIDRGLVNSRYGIVVLSRAFFRKNWTQYELDGLTAREIDGVRVILPIWHRVSKKLVLTFSPSLADKVALESSKLSVHQIAKQLLKAM